MTNEKYFNKAGHSFRELFKNLVLYVPDIVYYVVTAILAVLFLYLNNLSAIFSNISLFGEQLKTITNSSNLLSRLFITLGVFVIINIAVGLGTISLRYSLVKQVINKKKANLWKAYQEGRRYVWNILGIKIVLIIIYLVPLVVFGAIAFAYRPLIIPMIILIVISWIVLKFALLFIYPVLFLKTKGVFKTIKENFDYFNKKTKHVILTGLFLIIVGAIVGIVASIFMPVSLLSVTAMLIFGIIIKSLINISVLLWSSLFLFKNYS